MMTYRQVAAKIAREGRIENLISSRGELPQKTDFRDA